MKALHRLVGNTPKRGFGVGLFSPGFPGGFKILANTEIRLPLTNVPGEKNAGPLDGPVDAYRVFEIQPLRYGLVAAFQSVKVNIAGSRPCSYTDVAVPSGDEVGKNVTDGPGIQAILRFRGFIPSEEFLRLDRNSLDITAWDMEEEEALERFSAPASFTPKAHRALLRDYWQAASAQYFGPWDPRTSKYQFEAHPVMREFLPPRYRVAVCLGREESCEGIIAAARSFIWKYVLRLLPAQVSNIASMSAAVPSRFISSIYGNSALTVVYPEQNENIRYDLRSGSAPDLTEEEDAFIQMTLRGERPALLAEMARLYIQMAGAANENDVPFLADYDVAYQAYRLEQPALPARERLKRWYALHTFLRARHGMTWEEVNRVLRPLDEKTLEALLSRKAEWMDALNRQPDEMQNKVTGQLISFLWRKALSAGEGTYQALSPVLAAYHGPKADFFFSESLAEAGIENADEEKRAAALAGDILEKNFQGSVSLTSGQMALLRGEGFGELCAAHPALAAVLRAYLEEEGERRPDNMLAMLPLTVKFLNREALMGRLFGHLLSNRPCAPLSTADCACVRAGLGQLPKDSPALAGYTDYLAACFADNPGSVQDLAAMASAVDADTSEALVKIIGLAAERRQKLTAEQTALLLGENKRGTVYALCAQPAPVARAFRDYLEAMTVGEDDWREDRTLWLMGERKNAKACLLEASSTEEEKAWTVDLVIRYNAERGKKTGAPPAEKTFDFLKSLSSARHPAFARLSSSLLEMYDAVLEKGGAEEKREAEGQLSQLLSSFASTRGYPQVLQAEGRLIGKKLMEAWQGASYWEGVQAAEEDFRRSGLAQSQVLTAPVRKAACDRLDAELSPLSSFMDFSARYNAYLAAPEFPPDEKNDGFSQLCFSKLQERFIDRFDDQAAQCRSLEELRQLQAFSRAPMKVSRQTDAALGGMCIREIENVAHTLDGLSDQEDVGQMLIKARSCAQALSDERLAASPCFGRAYALLKQHYLTERRGEMRQRPFPVRLAVGLVCNISPSARTILWGDVIALMCPGYEGMMRAPFSNASVPLFQTIRFTLAALAKQVDASGRPSMKWAQSLISFLNSDPAFADYSAKARKDKKALKNYLPNLLYRTDAEGEALRAWLAPEGADRK